MPTAPQPSTIDGVVRVLDGIIDDCYRRRSRLGFFAALYRRVTVEVQDEIGVACFVLPILDAIGGRLDESLCHFCLVKARASAWRKALALHDAPPARRPKLIELFDQETRKLARRIYDPESILDLVTARIRACEINNVRAIIDEMR